MLVGEPIAVDDLLRGAAAEGWSEEKLHVAIADRVGQVRRRRLPLALLCLPAHIPGVGWGWGSGSAGGGRSAGASSPARHACNPPWCGPHRRACPDRVY